MNILLLLLFIIALSYLTFLGFYLLSNYPTQIRQLKNFKQACAKNDITTIRSLLNKQNFNPNRATIGKITGMHIACKNGHIEAVSTLLTHPNIQPNQTNSHGQTPFYMACINNRHELVSHLLLDKTFNVNQPDKKQILSMRHAARPLSMDLIRVNSKYFMIFYIFHHFLLTYVKKL